MKWFNTMTDTGGGQFVRDVLAAGAPCLQVEPVADLAHFLRAPRLRDGATAADRYVMGYAPVAQFDRWLPLDRFFCYPPDGFAKHIIFAPDDHEPIGFALTLLMPPAERDAWLTDYFDYLVIGGN